MVIKRKGTGEKSPVLYFILPALILVGVVLIYPILYAVGISFFNWPLVDETSRGFIGISNYIRIFQDKEFWHALLLQLGFIFIAIPLELIIGFFVAILLNREFKGVKWIRSLLLLPVFVLPVLSGLTWRLMLQPEYGAISFILTKLGLPQTAWLAKPGSAYAFVIIQDIWRMWPFMFMFLYSGLINIPTSLLEAADLDGARFWNKTLKIIVPLLRPTITTALLLRLIDALRIFSEVFVMTEGGPGNATTLLSLYIYKQAFRYFNIGYASAMGVILIIISLIIAILLVRRNIDID
ncbi:carbohydrate ABC transporter permease [Petrotoga sp. 9PWA.NaAc.5.4]|uniref:carbohydrate ABC transporter permease n=1 Tax=Petrotoga sp. 9PWA.NaAc.5.4 TaxID=1434328 RepID=UPI000CC123CD|nr:sugar ABC transporter permease [Petrotoga sp. 9PWA.NaAc.5.4]PNR96759.1 ABC transporter permease [Petrotoga sp. 9PWA.NaAc.5.4]